MKLNQIRDIAVVAERGSLRAAARHLGIAQPALSRSIRELEHELGVTLLDRAARGVTLTPMGETFLRRAQAVRNELRQAREELDQMKGLTTGQVSVALSNSSHIALLPWALPRFRAAFPGVFIRVREALFPSVEAALRSGELDFYVGPLAESRPAEEFAVEQLFDNMRLVFGRKHHPLRGARSLRDLCAAEWIATAVTLDNQAEIFPLFDAHGLPRPNVRMVAHSALTMIVAAANSDLLMILPRQWLGYPGTLENLSPFDLQETIAAPPICIVRRARLPLTPAAEYFADLIRRAGQHHAEASRGVDKSATDRQIPVN